MNRRDDVMELYKPSGILSKVEKILFCIDIIAAIVSLVANQVISSVAITIQIVVALLYFISNTIDDGCFWYEAEKQRRKNAIQNGFGTRLSEYETEDYYNNDLHPSLEKYGMNILESNYFSKIISGKMMIKTGICAIVAVVALIIACIFMKDTNILLLIAQTVFSTYVLVDFVMLVLYKIRMEDIYNNAYNILILGNQTCNRQAWLVAYIVEYEAIKAHYKVRLDEKIFNEINAELSAKWQNIISHRTEQSYDNM